MALIERLTTPPGSPPRAVVLRALGLGDTLAAVPALRAVRRGLPDHRLTVVLPAPLAPLLDLAGLDADVVPRAGFGDPPPAGHAEVAVNLHGRGPQSHRWLEQLAPERWVAFAEPTLGVRGPSWDPAEHERKRWCRLVGSELGVAADPDDVLLTAARHRRAPASGPEWAVLHPGAASASRRWPAERYAAVAGALVARGLRVVLTGSPAEAPLLDQVRAASGVADRVVPASTTDVTDLVRLVSGARLVVCGDTGMAHVASATGTPSVVLFGPVPPALWGPPPTGPHRALWAGRPGGPIGDPHGTTPDETLLRLTVTDVLGAVDSLPGTIAGRRGW